MAVASKFAAVERAVRRSAYDLAFPVFCIGCGSEGAIFCSDCAAKLSVDPTAICPVCKRSGATRCCPNRGVSSLWTLSSYSDRLAAESIRKIKYEYVSSLAQAYWQVYFEKFWQRYGEVIGNDCLIVPVPLHRRRLLERGFNQSELFARLLAEISGLRVETGLLRRTGYNDPQVGLDRASRISNVKGRFSIDYRRLSDCWDKKLLLLDDVYTTGSTMGECAHTLKLHGFSRINGLVLAVD